MATQSPPSSDSLALVNSFYGPGATACWYLTCLSCLISWSVHPAKRKSDTINNDFIALVTFPTIASAHLITQVRSWPLEKSLVDVDDETLLLQMRASLAASLIVTETYLLLCIILILPGLFARVPKRLCLLAITGIFGVASETYLYFALPSLRRAPGIFERSFVIDSLLLLVLILILVSVLVGLLLLYLFTILRKSWHESTIAELPTDLDSDTEDDFGLKSKKADLARLTYMAIPFMFLSSIYSVSPISFDLLVKTYLKKKTNWSGRRGFVDEFFPRTKASIMDLDQAVALLVGLLSLGFSLYGTADARYKRWWAEEQERQREAVRDRMQRREMREALWRHWINV